MDMLYSRYACPMDFMNGYINRGQFGKFVESFLDAEYERRKEEAEKDDDWKMWLMYTHSYSSDSFIEWKKKVLKNTDDRKANKDADLTDDGIKAIYNDLFTA